MTTMTPQPLSPGTCLGCRRPSAASRCDYCGVALRAGEYVVERVLSQNGHGRVYLARRAQEQTVIVKELLFATAPSAKALDALEQEGALLQRLRHPRIPRFLDRFREGEGPDARIYLVQAYVQGETLLQRLGRGRLAEREALDIAEQVLGILRALHDQRPMIVHRDVKPANLIRGTDGQLHLVDFGAARVLENDETHRGTLVGTFGYMPLEQMGGTVDQSVDLYALGATVIHLLSGREPAEFITPGMRFSLDASFPASKPVRQWLQRMTAPRHERFASSAEALDALHDARYPAGSFAGEESLFSLFASKENLARIAMMLVIGALVIALAVLVRGTIFGHR